MFPLYRTVSGSSMCKSGSASMPLADCIKLRRESGRIAEPPRLQVSTRSTLAGRQDSFAFQSRFQTLQRFSFRLEDHYCSKEQSVRLVSLIWYLSSGRRIVSNWTQPDYLAFPE